MAFNELDNLLTKVVAEMILAGYRPDAILVAFERATLDVRTLLDEAEKRGL